MALLYTPASSPNDCGVLMKARRRCLLVADRRLHSAFCPFALRASEKTPSSSSGGGVGASTAMRLWPQGAAASVLTRRRTLRQVAAAARRPPRPPPQRGKRRQCEEHGEDNLSRRILCPAPAAERRVTRFAPIQPAGTRVHSLHAPKRRRSDDACAPMRTPKGNDRISVAATASEAPLIDGVV
uniref:Uncharacterized protein n=1 Tax=Steinernema glaseri TaxID=37863 RepID=A0A1I8AW82_9BILA